MNGTAADHGGAHVPESDLPTGDSHPETWIVIPMFNEGEVIGDVITAVRARFANVVCVDDGSSDDCAERARAAGAHVVVHPINLGQGAALQTGLEYALSREGAQYFVTFDSDGQHRPEDAAVMVELLRSGEVDVVLGSRFLDGRTQVGALKRLVLKAAVRFSNFTSGMRLTDAHNGLRALNRAAVLLIQIRQNRMAHASEIIDKIGRSDLRWREVPVHIIYTDYSRSKGQSLLNSVNILTELLYR